MTEISEVGGTSNRSGIIKFGTNNIMCRQ